MFPGLVLRRYIAQQKDSSPIRQRACFLSASRNAGLEGCRITRGIETDSISGGEVAPQLRPCGCAEPAKESSGAEIRERLAADQLGAGGGQDASGESRSVPELPTPMAHSEHAP